MSQSKDYYAALGLDKEATEADIKKAYRKLAMTCHPDKNPDDPQAKEKFQAISEAYSILSDAEKKGMYDRGELDDDGAEFDMNDFMQVLCALSLLSFSWRLLFAMRSLCACACHQPLLHFSPHRPPGNVWRRFHFSNGWI
jgi:curved DNA-binding protein CbpA